jgi:hypothetical protein
MVTISFTLVTEHEYLTPTIHKAIIQYNPKTVHILMTTFSSDQNLYCPHFSLLVFKQAN